MALKSERFAGEQVLEDCLKGTAVLRVGATGRAVLKVQQAVIDLGIPLPPGNA